MITRQSVRGSSRNSGLGGAARVPFRGVALHVLAVLIIGLFATGEASADLTEAGCWSHGLRDATSSASSGVYSPSGQAGGPIYCGGRVSGGASVYLFSGEFFQREIDLRIPGRGLDFIWARKYRSRIGPNEGIGFGWDFSYNLRISPVEIEPGEVQDLSFDGKETLIWNAPIVPGGSAVDLRYCTLRSTQPDGFDNGAVASLIEIDSEDQSTPDTDVPLAGEVYYYLVRAQNGVRQGPLGTDSDGSPRAGLACGLTGPDFVLADGNTRRDLYRLQADGTWTNGEFFRVLSENPDGSHTLTFPDGKTWNFNASDGGVAEGKIDSIVDRTGNALSFQYDPAGRLASVTDTLGRLITIGYDADGFLETVNDFSGREVRYAYYQASDAGGSFGDLKSVRTPVVTGTSTGNDFPLGKTTIYTYSKGFADERLNHNLLTVTDPKGQTRLTNIYSLESDPAQLEFDRVVTQLWGDPGDHLDYVYVSVTPDPANNNAVLKTIVNDRVGNVTEYFFDDRNLAVQRLELTGRADPDLPTTEATNRPGPPLRIDDPAFFKKTWFYDGNTQLTRADFPNLNRQLFAYDALNPSRRSQGNLLQHDLIPGPLGGDQASRVETFEYSDDLCGCPGAGTNFVTRHVDFRGNVTLHTYDSFGNRVHTQHRLPTIVEDFEYNGFGQLTAHTLPDNGTGHRRRDEFVYYAASFALGYLEQTIVDAMSLALTTAYEYDSLGNIVRVTDPRIQDTQYEVNALNQVVRATSREPGPGIPRYQRDFFFDANDNLVRMDVQNVDGQGVVQSNSHFTTVIEFDALDVPLFRCEESGDYTGPIPGPTDLPTCNGLPDAEFVTTEHQYDANRNRTLLRLGEAVNGGQPANIVETRYDERDLILKTIRAPGDTDQSTMQWNYDPNGNIKRTIQGLEDTPRERQFSYDGYDRLLTATDPMGNVTSMSYDENGNRTSWRIDGELDDVAGSAGNVRLLEEAFDYDDMDRLIQREAQFFDVLSQLPILDGLSTTTMTYSDASQITRVTDDNGYATSVVHDSAYRVLSITDAKGNSLTYDYDGNSNPTTITELERSDLGQSDQTFITNYVYDGLDRMIEIIDSVGNPVSYGYDSRNNRTRVEDAQRPLLSDPGNVTTYDYDGLGRLVSTTRELTATGMGTGAPTGAITTIRSWDDSSRLIDLSDDNGHATTYDYDPLGRLTAIDYADGTQRVSTYDVHDNPVTQTDPNGTVVTNSYDLLDRLVSRAIERAAVNDGDPVDVLGTTFEEFGFDGRSRPISAEDDDSLVLLEYDSLSNVTSDNQDGSSVVRTFDGAGNALTSGYPGGRTITRTFDGLNRVATVADGIQTIADYDYVGRNRVEQRDYDNGTRLSWEYDGITGVPNPAGDFGVRRPIGTTHSVIVGGALLDERGYEWDRMQNKTQRSETGGPQYEYEYDSIYRLKRSARVPAVPPPGTIDYTLDGVSNRVSVTGGPDAGAYTLDATMPDPADLQVNQYTATPFDAREYDPNGNLIAIDAGLPTQRLLHYDYRDRLVDHAESSGPFSTYAYDALGRRIEKVASPGPTIVYLYDGTNVVEERNAMGATLATYVYGRRGASPEAPDDMLQMTRGGADHYCHADDVGNVVALTDISGSVLESYDYDDYGRPFFFNALGNPIPQSAELNPFLFAGRRYDGETGWYLDGSRYLDPRAGRFVNRDTATMWFESNSLGNGSAYAGDNPWSGFGSAGGVFTLPAAAVRSPGFRSGGSAPAALTGSIAGSSISPLCFGSGLGAFAPVPGGVDSLGCGLIASIETAGAIRPASPSIAGTGWWTQALSISAMADLETTSRIADYLNSTGLITVRPYSSSADTTSSNGGETIEYCLPLSPQSLSIETTELGDSEELGDPLDYSGPNSTDGSSEEGEICYSINVAIRQWDGDTGTDNDDADTPITVDAERGVTDRPVF